MSLQDMSSGEYSRFEREKRKQVNRACETCRKAHAACDEMRPCKRCIARGEADSCVDRHGSGKQPQQVARPNREKFGVARRKEKKARQHSLADMKFRKNLQRQLRLQQQSAHSRGLESNSQTEHSEHTDLSESGNQGESSDCEHGPKVSGKHVKVERAAPIRPVEPPLLPATLVHASELRTPSPMGLGTSGTLGSSVESQDPSEFRGLFEIENVNRYTTPSYKTQAPSSRLPPSASPYLLPNQVSEHLLKMAKVLSCSWGDDAPLSSTATYCGEGVCSRSSCSEFLAL